jgi:predicted AAA+ superfamily ATPase
MVPVKLARALSRGRRTALPGRSWRTSSSWSWPGQLTWADERARLHHYRTKDKLEVDAVIETADGRVIAVEVKAGATVRTEDIAGLRNLARHLGDKFLAGYVLYTGQQTLSYGGRIKALPMDARWSLAP